VSSPLLMAVMIVCIGSIPDFLRYYRFKLPLLISIVFLFFFVSGRSGTPLSSILNLVGKILLIGVWNALFIMIYGSSEFFGISYCEALSKELGVESDRSSSYSWMLECSIAGLAFTFTSIWCVCGKTSYGNFRVEVSERLLRVDFRLSIRAGFHPPGRAFMALS
jgi:hypothetical protein